MSHTPRTLADHDRLTPAEEQQLREMQACPLCNHAKTIGYDDGLLVCWRCYRAHDMRHGLRPATVAILRAAAQTAAESAAAPTPAIDAQLRAYIDTLPTRQHRLFAAHYAHHATANTRQDVSEYGHAITRREQTPIRVAIDAMITEADRLQQPAAPAQAQQPITHAAAYQHDAAARADYARQTDEQPAGYVLALGADRFAGRCDLRSSLQPQPFAFAYVWPTKGAAAALAGLQERTLPAGARVVPVYMRNGRVSL